MNEPGPTPVVTGWSDSDAGRWVLGNGDEVEIAGAVITEDAEPRAWDVVATIEKVGGCPHRVTLTPLGAEPAGPG